MGLTGLDVTYKQLTSQLREAVRAQSTERRLKEDVLVGTPSVCTQLEELSAERKRLSNALQVMDSAREDLARVATAKADELNKLRTQFSQLETAQVETQWSNDRLRHALDMQQRDISKYAGE